MKCGCCKHQNKLNLFFPTYIAYIKSLVIKKPYIPKQRSIQRSIRSPNRAAHSMVSNKVVCDYVTTSQNLNTPQQRWLITLTSFGFSTNSKWAVKSANLHREYFRQQLGCRAFVCAGRGLVLTTF